MNTPGQLSVDNIVTLEICAKVEEKNAELYYLFAEQFSGVPDTNNLWKQTAQEEEQHANQIRLGARLGKGGIASINMDAGKANRMLEAVTSLVKKAQATPPSYKDALRVSLQLEEKLADFHMYYLSNFSDDQCASLFKSMMKCDKQHIDRLKAAYEEATSDSSSH